MCFEVTYADKGETWRNHPDVRHMAYEFHNLSNGLPPFGEDSRGEIYLSVLENRGHYETGSVDATVAKRYEILLRLVLFDYLKHIQVELDVYRSTWYEALADPFYLTPKVKGLRGIGDSMQFAATPRYPSVVWGGNKEWGYSVTGEYVFENGNNDAEWLRYYAPEHWQPTKDKIEGFSALKAAFEKYATAPGTPINKRGSAEIRGIDQVAGYFGGIFTLAVRDQTAKQAPTQPYINMDFHHGEEALYPFMTVRNDNARLTRRVLKNGPCPDTFCQYCMTYKAWRGAIENIYPKIPTSEKFKRALMSLTTSKSGGVKPENIEFRMPSGKIETVTIRSKAALLLLFANRIFDPELVKSEYLGRLSTRSDLARDIRYICMIPDFIYYYESAFAELLARNQAQDDRYSTRKMDERFFSNMAPWLVLLSQSFADFLIVCYDVSAMDLNTMWSNYFEPLLDALS